MGDQTRQERLGCFSKITLLAGEEKSETSDQWPFTIEQNEYDETIRLLYCEAPPGIEQASYHTHPREVKRNVDLAYEILFPGEASVQGRKGEGVRSEKVATYQVKGFWIFENRCILHRAILSTDHFQEN